MNPTNGMTRTLASSASDPYACVNAPTPRVPRAFEVTPRDVRPGVLESQVTRGALSSMIQAWPP